MQQHRRVRWMCETTRSLGEAIIEALLLQEVGEHCPGAVEGHPILTRKQPVWVHSVQ
jgi:hypothetical protein